MKKIISIMVGLCLLLAVFSGCSATNKPETSNDKISVVSTIFAPYDFIREIAGDKADITMLLLPGSESHSFEPTPQDIIKIQNCDVFVYAGGDSDAWVQEVLESMDTSKMKIVTLMDCVQTVEEELVEGMEEDHGHSHEEEDFSIEDVKDRELTDWEGDWQSVYPHLLSGALTPVMEHKAEADIEAEKESPKTAAQYYDYYETAYKTDVDRVVITADSMSFYINGTPATAQYAYKGTGIIEEEESLWVRYKFEAVGNPPAGAPKYIMFSDHLHAPEKTEHFHIYSSNNSFDEIMADTDPKNFPTYYDSNLNATELVDEMLGHDGGEEHELDEHVWTSPKNAKLIVQKISDTLCAVDAENATTYKENTASYLSKLDELDTAFQNVVNSATRKTIVFGDRFPFRYLADAYGLEYFAAFPGCSTETEASGKTVAFLIDKIKTEKIPVVFHVELSNMKMANTISESTGAKVLLLHACHNVSKAEFESGISYLDLMNQNVENLKEALK